MYLQLLELLQNSSFVKTLLKQSKKLFDLYFNYIYLVS